MYFVDVLELRPVLPDLFAFPPNRATLGGTAYLILRTQGNLLVDCPAWSPELAAALADRGGVAWLLITHRDAMAQVAAFQKALGCRVLVQEQEAYLLPGVDCQTFGSEWTELPQMTALWTPGYSPGSSCFHWGESGGVLFTGRHLLPDALGNLRPLRHRKTFHWGRQVRSVARLQAHFAAAPLAWMCPGANSGFLRGRYALDRAAERLADLDPQGLMGQGVGL